jgi:hypothetical protein
MKHLWQVLRAQDDDTQVYLVLSGIIYGSIFIGFWAVAIYSMFFWKG